MPKGYETDNELMSEMKKRQVQHHQFNLEIIFWNLKNELITYQTEFDRLQGAKRLSALQPDGKKDA